jgi:MFS family permease
MQTTEEIVGSAPLADATARTPRWRVLASASFRKLFAATTLSLFGTFFSYIASAWLVLQLTGSSLALGSVLVIQALPRAVLMVVGGAVTDRFSPRATLLASMGLRTVFVTPLALLVLAGRTQMWEVYVISVVFGVVDAFFLPARQAILPKVVADHELEPGNALLNVSSMLSILIGPVAAGLVITAWGLGWAFAGDAACFGLGFLFILWLPSPVKDAAAAPVSRGLHLQIADGLRYAWSDFGIRIVLIVIAVIDFAANGALGVGLPTLTHGRLAAGASGFGILLGAWGVGATVGALGSGAVKVPQRFGAMTVIFCFWLGIGIAGAGFAPSLLVAGLFMAFCGLGVGVVNTYAISWLQRRTDRSMQGRVMSIIMLASTGVTPLAYAVSGAIAQINPTLLFALAGGMMIACGAAIATSGRVRALA